jgi:hypothetical protein
VLGGEGCRCPSRRGVFGKVDGAAGVFVGVFPFLGVWICLEQRRPDARILRNLRCQCSNRYLAARLGKQPGIVLSLLTAPHPLGAEGPFYQMVRARLTLAHESHAVCYLQKYEMTVMSDWSNCLASSYSLRSLDTERVQQKALFVSSVAV